MYISDIYTLNICAFRYAMKYRFVLCNFNKIYVKHVENILLKITIKEKSYYLLIIFNVLT